MAQQQDSPRHASRPSRAATALAEPSARPVLRWAADSNGMITVGDTAAGAMPTVEEPHLVHTHGAARHADASRAGRFLPGLGRLT